jgi:DNA-binding NarL/FixJ family response regulator
MGRKFGMNESTALSPGQGAAMVKILIADDHDVVRSGLRAVLEVHPGWEIVGEATDGRAAIEQAVATKPEVVVLDYSLPLVNGTEVTRQIRAKLPHTEVLIFTMHDSDALVREVLQAGARGYVLKSDAQRYLVAAVESLSTHRPFFTARGVGVLMCFDGTVSASSRGAPHFPASGHSTERLSPR